MSSKLGKIAADFTTQLALKVSVGGTTGALQSQVDDDGVNLADGNYFFTLDGSSSIKEHIFCTKTGLNLTNIKSVSRQGVLTTGVAREHRVGAAVSITDFAHIMMINNLLSGADGLDSTNPLAYDGTPTLTDSKQIATKGYVDGVAIAGGVPATPTVTGISKTDQANNTNPRVANVLVQQQTAANLTLKVLPFDFWENEKNISFAGGNTPGFISPSLQVTISIPNQPANADTWSLTINGTVVSGVFVSSIGATPGNVLIGGNAAATQANLLALLQAPGTTNANQVALSGGNQTLINYCGYTSVSTSIVCQGLNNTAITSLTGAISTAGNSVTTNTNPRVDVVVYDLGSSGLKIVQGTTAASPSLPTLSSLQVPICEVYLRTGMASIKDTDDTTNGYIQRWVRPSLFRTDLITTSNIANIPIKFGGTGSDGALVISSGTTTIDCANAALVVKNYTSISITGTGKLAFINPGTNGTIVFIRSQGAVTLTSSQTPMIDMTLMGGAGGTGGSIGNSGSAGTAGFNNLGGATIAGNFGTITVPGSATTSAGAVAIQQLLLYSRYIRLFTGAGGGGGGGGVGANTGAGGAGGKGAGGLVIECAGALNFTTTSGISVGGQVGTQGFDTTGAPCQAAGGGGGGAGGCFIMLYNSLTANSGTVTFAGGTGGRGGNPAGGGSGAGGTGGAGGNGTSGNGQGGAGTSSTSSGSGGAGGSGGGSDSGLSNGSTAGNASASSGVAGGGGGGGASGYSLVAQNVYFA